MCGLFKKKLNFRITFLKKRSLIFGKFFKKKVFFKKRFKKFFKKKLVLKLYKNQSNYKVRNIDLTKRKKLIFFENRKMIRLFLKNKSLKKQDKLTTYLVNLLKLDGKNLLNTFEFKLNVILIKCHFFSDLKDSNFFIKNGFILVNNKTVFNENYIVKYSDIINLISKKKYYWFYRFNINNSLYSLKKLN